MTRSYGNMTRIDVEIMTVHDGAVSVGGEPLFEERRRLVKCLLCGGRYTGDKIMEHDCEDLVDEFGQLVRVAKKKTTTRGVGQTRRQGYILVGKRNPPPSPTPENVAYFLLTYICNYFLAT